MSHPAPPYSGCTVATPMFLAHARVLAESFFRHNADAGFTLLHLGETGRRPEERAAALGLDPRVEVLEPADLVDPEELARMGLMYSAQGLAGAMKGRLLRHVAGSTGRPAILIDADICVYRSLAPLAEHAERAGAVLTPHIQRPLIEAERPTLLAGVFNSGFIAIGEQGLGLLDWWNERTARHCVLSPNEGLLWEQAWLGLAPAFFPLEVLRDPGMNAMTRDLIDHDVEGEGEELSLRGSPLSCFHFSGPYDPHQPEFLLAASTSGPEVVMRPEGADPAAQLAWLKLENRPGALRMSQDYAGRLLAAGYEEAAGSPLLFAELPGGTSIHPAMRHAYRTALLSAEASGASGPPNPFAGATTAAFISWLAAAPDAEAGRQGLSRFLLAVRESYPGVARVFPDVPGADAEAFRAWAGGRLGRERVNRAPEELLPPDGGLATRAALERARGEADKLRRSRAMLLASAPRRLAGRIRRSADEPTRPDQPRPAAEGGDPVEAGSEGPALAAQILGAFTARYPRARFLEIGANDGQRLDPLTPFIAANEWRGVMVEPVPYVFERLRRHFEDRPEIEVENVAIAESEGTRTFYHLAEEAQEPEGGEGRAIWWYDAIGSFDREHLYKHAAVVPDFEARLREIEVRCTTVAELCRSHDLGNPDLILIDTEGYDARIVASIDLDEIRPRLLIYEHHHLGEEERASCEARLRAHGYELIAEGLDTWCLDARVDDELRAAWHRLIAAGG